MCEHMPRTKKTDSAINTIEKAQTVIKSPQVTSVQSILVMVAASLIIIIGLRYIAMDLIAPILLAIFFTILMMPLFQWFRRRGHSRGVSLFLMISTMVLSVTAFIWFFQWSIGLISSSLEETFAAFRATLETTAESMGIATSATAVVTETITPETVTSIISFLASSLGNFFYFFVIIPIIAILLLLQVDAIPQEVTDEMIKQRPMLARLTRFARSVIVYVTARFKVNLLTGILLTIALFFLDIEFAVVWGILAIFLSFIPYVGLVVASIPPIFLGFVSGGVFYAVIVGVTLVGTNLLVENIVDPFIQGKESKLSTATVVIALIFWAWLLGFVGALLSIPLTVLIKTILADYPETKWISQLMEGQYQVAAESKAGQESLVRKLTNLLPK